MNFEERTPKGRSDYKPALGSCVDCGHEAFRLTVRQVSKILVKALIDYNSNGFGFHCISNDI